MVKQTPTDVNEHKPKINNANQRIGRRKDMYLPKIDLTKSLQNNGCLQPEGIDCEREIMPYVLGRKRFDGLLQKLKSIKNSTVSSDTFGRSFNKHIFIHCANTNDGLLAAVLTYNAISVKCGASCCLSENIIDRSRTPAAPDLGGNMPVNPQPAKFIFAPPGSDLRNIRGSCGSMYVNNSSDSYIDDDDFYEDDDDLYEDDDDFYEVDDNLYEDDDDRIGNKYDMNTEITAELFFCHSFDPDELREHDPNRENLCIFIYSDEDIEKEEKKRKRIDSMMPSMSAAPAPSPFQDPKQEAAKLHCTYIEIPPDSKEELKGHMLDFLAKQKYDTSKVTKQLERLVSFPYIRNEAQAVAAAKNIISKHIENCGDLQKLTPFDFSDYFPAEKKSGSKDNIVGLEKERKILDSMTDMLMFNIERKSMKLSEEDVSCNMVFAGPPGTAKTTLARLFAKKLADLGVIPGDKNFRECRKSDIVGQYVGQTANKVDTLFREMEEAGGGVIFFDEIYSISEQNATCYDTEALTCITQNIENCRGSVFCIFAGYEAKMREFIAKNQGLSSRISAMIIFSEYSDEALCHIFNSFITTDNLKISGECETILRSFFSSLRKKKGESFGNGREARNLFEAAKRVMASRIYAGKQRSANAMSTMLASDIQTAAEELLNGVINEEKRSVRIGF